MNDNQIDTDRLSEEVALAQLKDLAGATTAEDMLNWAQALASDNLRARAILNSLSVVSVLMADGQVIGLQLPAGAQTPDGLDALRDGLLQGAVNIGNVARSARAEAAKEKG